MTARSTSTYTPLLPPLASWHALLKSELGGPEGESPTPGSRSTISLAPDHKNTHTHTYRSYRKPITAHTQSWHARTHLSKAKPLPTTKNYKHTHVETVIKQPHTHAVVWRQARTHLLVKGELDGHAGPLVFRPVLDPGAEVGAEALHLCVGSRLVAGPNRRAYKCLMQA